MPGPVVVVATSATESPAISGSVYQQQPPSLPMHSACSPAGALTPCHVSVASPSRTTHASLTTPVDGPSLTIPSMANASRHRMSRYRSFMTTARPLTGLAYRSQVANKQRKYVPRSPGDHRVLVMYVELHAASAFSFLEAASLPERWWTARSSWAIPRWRCSIGTACMARRDFISRRRQQSAGNFKAIIGAELTIKANGDAPLPAASSARAARRAGSWRASRHRIAVRGRRTSGGCRCWSPRRRAIAICAG